MNKMEFPFKRYIVAVLAFLGLVFITLLEGALPSTLYARQYAYMFSFIGGILSSIYGGATVLGIGVFVSASCCVVGQFSEHTNLWYDTLISFVDGLAQAFSYTAILDILARWFPIYERSKSTAFIIAGSYVGVLCNNTINTFLFESYGKRRTCIINGISATIWTILWILTVSNNPTEDKLISNAEKKLLTKQFESSGTKRMDLPSNQWKKILFSGPLWVLYIATSIFGCGRVFAHSYLYIYAKRRGLVSFQINEKLSNIVNIFIVAYLLLVGYLIDCLRATKITTTTCHKTVLCVSYFLTALLFVAYFFAERTIHLVVFYGLYELLRSFSETTLFANVVDLSPKNAGLIGGIQRSFLSVSYIMSIWYSNTTIVHLEPRALNYPIFVPVILFIVSAILYGIFGSGERQKFDSSQSEEYPLSSRDQVTK